MKSARELLERALVAVTQVTSHLPEISELMRAEELREEIRAYLAAPDDRPPREPTEEMMHAGARWIMDNESRPGSSWAEEAKFAWQAMYDAAPTGVRDDAPPTPIAWMVTRDYHHGHPSFGRPEFFATEPEANENACLGTVDAHVRPLYAAPAAVEPVAQQPIPEGENDVEAGSTTARPDRLETQREQCQPETVVTAGRDRQSSPVAQQPEAPPADTGDRLMCSREEWALIVAESGAYQPNVKSAFIAGQKSAAARIRELIDLAEHWKDKAHKWAEDGEKIVAGWTHACREAERELAASRERERALYYALDDLLDHFPGANSQRQIAAKGRARRALDDAVAHIATPDSAASPTGGEG